MDSRISLLNFDFAMIYIIHKIFLLIKNHMNYFKDDVFNAFLRSIIDFYFSKKFKNMMELMEYSKYDGIFKA